MAQNDALPPLAAGDAIAWATPLDRGPLRALYIGPRFTAAEVDELARRLEVEVIFEPVWDSAHLGYDPSLPETHREGGSYEETAARLGDALKARVDVIILANLYAAILPAEVQAAIAQRVEAGLGLVLSQVRLDGAPALESLRDRLAPLPIAAWPSYGAGLAVTPELAEASEVLQAGTHGVGRVVTLHFPGDLPQFHGLLPALNRPDAAEWAYAEQYYSLAAKAIAWAGGRTPDCWLTSVELLPMAGPREEEIPPELPEAYVQRIRDSAVGGPLYPLRLKLNGAAPERYQVDVQVRRVGLKQAVIHRQSVTLERGMDFAELQVFAGPGDYLVDVWLRTRRGVVDWYIAPLRFSGWPVLERLVFSKTAVQANDRIEIQANIRPNLHRPSTASLYARAFDPYDRQVAEGAVAVPEGGGTLTLGLPLADLVAPWLKIEVYAVNAPPHSFADFELNGASFAYRYIPVQQVPLSGGAGLGVRTPYAAEYNARRALEQLREQGARWAYTGNTWDANYAAGAALWPLPELAQYAAPSALNGHERYPCLDDPLYHEEEATRLLDRAAEPTSAAATRVSLGWANCLVASDEEVCFAPPSVAAFQEELRTRYQEIGRLNETWGGGFRAWDEVMPLTRAFCLEAGQLAPYLDFRRFMEGRFALFHARAAQTLREGQPRRAVIAGLMPYTPARGYDYWALARASEGLIVPFERTAWAQVRSYGRVEASGAVLPGGLDAETAAWWVTRMAFEGFGILWWPSPPSTAHATFADAPNLPNGAPTAEFEAAAAACERLGGWPLPRNAAPTTEARPRVIGVLDSMDSRLLAEALAPALPDQRTLLSHWLALVEGLNFPYRLLDARDLNPAALEDVALLVVPGAVALRNGQRETLQTYLDAGGILIADLLPGRYDEFGHAASGTAPAEWFGVTAGDAPELALRTELRPNAPAWLESYDPPALDAATVDLSVSSATGEAAVWQAAVHETGPRALLLNHLPPAPSANGQTTPERALRHLLRRCATLGDASPLLPLRAEIEDDAKMLVRRDAEGSATTYMLLRPPGGPRQVTLKAAFEKGTYLYLPDAPTPFLRDLTPNLRMAPGQLLRLSALPYRVKAMDVETPDAFMRGGRLPVTIALDTGDATPGEHRVRVRLLTVTGKELPAYRRDVVLPRGVLETYLPLPINLPIGLYTITVTDMLTGLQAQNLFEVTL